MTHPSGEGKSVFIAELDVEQVGVRLLALEQALRATQITGNSANGWYPGRNLPPACDPLVLCRLIQSVVLSIRAASSSQFGYNRLLFSPATPTLFTHVAFEEAFFGIRRSP